MLWYYPSMFFRATRKELLATIVGATALTVLAGVLSRPVETLSPSMASLLQPALLIGIEVIFASVLLTGLAFGFLRHRDPSPLLFAILGAGGLFLLHLGNLPIFLPMICGSCFVISSCWSLLISTHSSVGHTEPPRLDDFLDQTITSPPEGHAKK